MTTTPQFADADVIDVTLSADTSIMADNDVIAATQEVTNFYTRPSQVVRLTSVLMYDGDDQNTDVDLVFLHTTGSIGAENATITLADAVAYTVVGHVELLAATHYVDFIDNRFAQKTNLNLLFKAADNTTSIFVAAVCRSGTPTYTAAGLRLKLGIERF